MAQDEAAQPAQPAEAPEDVQTEAAGAPPEQAEPATEPAADAAETAQDETTPGPDEGYMQWLEQYGAWDKLQQGYDIDSDAPDIILKKAEIALQTGDAAQALQVLERTPPFEDEAEEARRLWLGGRAYRALGRPAKAVLWFSQAGEHMEPRPMAKAFRSEDGLDTIWIDVWRRLFWIYAANPLQSREAQKLVLRTTLDQAKAVWGRDNFWAQAQQVLDGKTPAGAAEATALTPSEGDRAAVARALAAVSIGDFEAAASLLLLVQDATVQEFWSGIVDFLEVHKVPESLDIFSDSDYVKPATFWSAGLLTPGADAAAWFLGDAATPAWDTFRKKLLEMDPDDALVAIDKEMDSLFIDERTRTLLQGFKLALAAWQGRMEAAEEVWLACDRPALPLGLKLVGLILFDARLDDVLSCDSAEATRTSALLTILASAAGRDVAVAWQAPFWVQVSQNRLNSVMANIWPLDRLLVLADWQHRWQRDQDMDLARRVAFLFPDTTLGVDCILALADAALQNQRFKLSGYYLGMLEGSSLNADQRNRALGVRAKLDLDVGRDDEALRNFKELLKDGGELPVMTRLRLALLLQQKGDLAGARKHLLLLWDQREALDTAMQAEILFWLGEGEHARGNMDAALDYYLKLAFEYPQENIWALTAMYRASMIYEAKGNFATAKKLLGTVIERADRKEQREAAKARLTAIEGKMGRAPGDRTGSVAYPF